MSSDEAHAPVHDQLSARRTVVAERPPDAEAPNG